MSACAMTRAQGSPATSISGPEDRTFTAPLESRSNRAHRQRGGTKYRLGRALARHKLVCAQRCCGGQVDRVHRGQAHSARFPQCYVKEIRVRRKPPAYGPKIRLVEFDLGHSLQIRRFRQNFEANKNTRSEGPVRIVEKRERATRYIAGAPGRSDEHAGVDEGEIHTGAPAASPRRRAISRSSCFQPSIGSPEAMIRRRMRRSSLPSAVRGLKSARSVGVVRSGGRTDLLRRLLLSLALIGDPYPRIRPSLSYI